MKCHRCNSTMLLDRQETSGKVTTEWHSCAICNTVHMRSALDDQLSAFADRNDTHESNTDKDPVAYAPRQGIAYA